MRAARVKLVFLAAMALVSVAGCQAPQLPAPPTPDLRITDDDRQVMRAVLEYERASLYPWGTPWEEYNGIRSRLAGRQPAGTRLRALVFESTIALCEGDPWIHPPPLQECLNEKILDALRVESFSKIVPSLMSTVEGVPPDISGVVFRTLFRERNRRSMLIGGAIGADVVYVPPTVVTRRDLSEFSRLYSSESITVGLSAPVYVNGSALIYYTRLGESASFVQLIRRDGAWAIGRISGSRY